MAGQPRLTERAVRDWVGAAEVKKGRPYAEGDAVAAAVREGTTLKAKVQGTAYKPYRVWARLAGDRVTAADCSCPVGDGGRCKHVAALLLRYAAEPGEFADVEPIDANLQARDKAELIAIIKQMVRRAPELEGLLALPRPGSKKKAPPDPRVYRRQAAEVFREVPEYEEWAGEEAADAVGDIVGIGEGFEAADDFDEAAAVYQGVTAAVADDGRDLLGGDFESESDPTGRLLAGLLRCLNRLRPDDPKRESLLRSAFDLVLATGTDAPTEDGDRQDGLEAILAGVTPAERRTLAGWARQARPRGNDWSARYAREQLTELLLRIDADVMDDDRYLAVCREAGMYREVIARLLERGRRAEAAAEAGRRKDDREYLDYCDLLAEAGEGEAAERIVRSRPGWEKDHAALRWLIDHAEARGDAAGVVALTERRFALWPTLPDYRLIRDRTPAAAWRAKRGQLLHEVRGRGLWGLLIDILLDEGDVAGALRAVTAHRGTGRGAAVARAAEAGHPAEAAALYRRLAEEQIGQRNRAAYQEAVRHLKRAAELAGRLGEAADFQRYLAELLESHRTLRALREEVEKAKLVAEVPPTAVTRKRGRG